jgi:hypothetical protein
MTEKDFRAEEDMRVLADAEELERNPARKSAAVTRARERATELTNFADKHAASPKSLNNTTGLGLADLQARKKR